VSFSYPNAAQIIAQNAAGVGNNPTSTSAKDAAQPSTNAPPEQFPYLIATSSLDGTTKLWHPFFHRTVQPLVAYEPGCVLGKDLLQTIYTKQNPVHKAFFTSRNLLLLITTNNSTQSVSTLREAM
jgi:hypothetical protein